MTGSSFKLFIFSFLLLGASLAVVAFVIYQQEKQGEALRARLVDLKAWERATMAEDSLATGQDGSSNLQTELRSYVLLSEADTISFLTTVENTVVEAGAEIRTVELKKERTPDPKFDELEITFSIRGGKAAVEKSIKLLEVLPYRSYIHRITLTRGDVSSEATVVMRVSIIK